MSTPSPEKQHSSHSSRKKSSSKAASAACKDSLTSRSPVAIQSVITPGTSSTASSRARKALGRPQFASNGSFKVMPITNRIKRHKGTCYIRAYCHRDNLYASAPGGSPRASSGEDKPDSVLSSGYPSPSYKYHSKGAIYRDISDPERGLFVICTYPHRDIFFVPLTQNGIYALVDTFTDTQCSKQSGSHVHQPGDSSSSPYWRSGLARLPMRQHEVPGQHSTGSQGHSR